MARGSYPVASNYLLLTGSGTTQQVTGRCSLLFVHIENVGTTATLDIYDATSGTTLKVFEWVSADGKGRFDIGIRMTLGLRVIVGGTTPRIVIGYEE